MSVLYKVTYLNFKLQNFGFCKSKNNFKKIKSFIKRRPLFYYTYKIIEFNCKKLKGLDLYCKLNL